MQAGDGNSEESRLSQGVVTPPRDGGGLSWLSVLGFAFLTFNSGLAIHRSQGDTSSIAFVVCSYVDLILIFCFLRRFERVDDPNSRRVRGVKVSVWVLTTLLTMMFSWKVAAVMPLAPAVMVWAMAAATVVGGFYAFFVPRETTSSLPTRA